MEKKAARKAAKKSRVERSADEESADVEEVVDEDKEEMEKEIKTGEVDRMGKAKKEKKEKKEKGMKKKNKNKKGGKKNKEMSEERKRKRAERKNARLEKKKAGKGRKTDEELGQQDEADRRSEDPQNCKVRFFRSLTNPFNFACKLWFEIFIFSLLGMSSKHPLLWRERTKRENLQKIIQNQRRISKKNADAIYPKHSVINFCYLLVFISYRFVTNNVLIQVVEVCQAA